MRVCVRAHARAFDRQAHTVGSLSRRIKVCFSTCPVAVGLFLAPVCLQEPLAVPDTPTVGRKSRRTQSETMRSDSQIRLPACF